MNWNEIIAVSLFFGLVSFGLGTINFIFCKFFMPQEKELGAVWFNFIYIPVLGFVMWFITLVLLYSIKH